MQIHEYKSPQVEPSGPDSVSVVSVRCGVAQVRCVWLRMEEEPKEASWMEAEELKEGCGGYLGLSGISLKANAV